MKISEEETVVMKVSRNRRAKAKVTLNGKQLKEVPVTCFIYLGNEINNEGRIHEEIDSFRNFLEALLSLLALPGRLRCDGQ